MCIRDRAYAGQSDAKPFPFKNVGFLNPNDIFSPCAVPVDNLIPQNNPNCADHGATAGDRQSLRGAEPGHPV